jgi:hypothetical protein
MVDVLTVHEQIAHGSVTLGHLPVVDGNFGSLHLLPFWQAASIQVFNLASVGDDRLFFEVAYESMNGAGAEEIGKKQSIAPDTYDDLAS